MALRQGRTTTVGIGEESTLGTPVSRTNWMKVFSVSGFEEKISKEKIPHLYHGAAGSPTFADVYSGAVTVEGKITGVFLYEGCGMLLKAVMGANPSSAAGTPNTHTFHMGTAIQPLTLEINRGTGGQSEIFTGCCVRSMTLTIEHGSPIKFEADIIGQKASANRSSAGSPTFAAFNKTNLKRYAAKPFHAASPVWNSVTYAIHGKTVITIDRRLEGVPVLGSRYIGDVVASDYGTVSISCDRINDGDTLYNGYKGDTVSDWTQTWTNDWDTADQALRITARNAMIMDNGTDLSGAGNQEEKVTWEAFSDDTDNAFSIEIDNGNASATAN